MAYAASSAMEKSEKKTKASRNTWSCSEEKELLQICKETKLREELDNCVTSAGVSEDKCIFAVFWALRNLINSFLLSF